MLRAKRRADADIAARDEATRHERRHDERAMMLTVMRHKMRDDDDAMMMI